MKSSPSITISTSSDSSESESLTKRDLGRNDPGGGPASKEVTSNRLGGSPSESVCLNARDVPPAWPAGLAKSQSMPSECFSVALCAKLGDYGLKSSGYGLKSKSSSKYKPNGAALPKFSLK